MHKKNNNKYKKINSSNIDIIAVVIVLSLSFKLNEVVTIIAQAYEGRPLLAAPIGLLQHRKQNAKVDEWRKEIAVLTVLAHTQPHGGCTAFTHDFSNEHSFHSTYGTSAFSSYSLFYFKCST